jgi:hypothetical protein
MKMFAADLHSLWLIDHSAAWRRSLRMPIPLAIDAAYIKADATARPTEAIVALRWPASADAPVG